MQELLLNFSSLSRETRSKLTLLFLKNPIRIACQCHKILTLAIALKTI